MKTGLAFPVQENGKGGFALVSGEEQLRKIIILSLMDLVSENPFQAELGLGSWMIFALQNRDLQNELRRRVQALFRRLQLQNRARLVTQPTFEVKPEEQVLEMVVIYHNMEENRPEDDRLALSFSSVRQGGSMTNQFTYSASKMSGLGA